MTAPAVDASRIRWSLPAADLAQELVSRPLLVMMHGYGSNADDLFGLVSHLPPQFVVASVEGLEPVGPGWAWFPLGVDPDTGALTRDLRRVDDAAASVLSWLDAVREAHPSIPSLHLLGFSQGAAMSLEVLRRRPHAVTSTTVLAGFALPSDTEERARQDAELAVVRPPVFWGRDPHDPVISADMIAFTQTWLTAHTEVSAREYSGVGHGISLPELEDVSSFLGTHATEE